MLHLPHHFMPFPFPLPNRTSLLSFKFFLPLSEFPFVLMLTVVSDWQAGPVLAVRLVSGSSFFFLPFSSLCLCDTGQTCYELEARQKKRTNDREGCQSNTQARRRCKHTCAHIKSFSGFPYEKFGIFSPRSLHQWTERLKRARHTIGSRGGRDLFPPVTPLSSWASTVCSYPHFNLQRQLRFLPASM